MDASKLVFLDTETTNLTLDGEIWDLAFDLDGQEYQFFFKPENWAGANAMSLKIGRYYERTSDLTEEPALFGEDAKSWSDPRFVAPKIAAMLEGRHIVGAVPNFDENFLKPWFAQNGAVLTTRYHLIDIETLIVGYLMAARSRRSDTSGVPFDLPWKSDDLSRLIGVDPDQFDRHTAIGDVRWVKAQWEALMTGADVHAPN